MEYHLVHLFKNTQIGSISFFLLYLAGMVRVKDKQDSSKDGIPLHDGWGDGLRTEKLDTEKGSRYD